MKQIIIGKEGNQPFMISDDYVSRIHAILSYEETTGAMTLINKGVNGTYIRMGNQFQQIEQCNVNATTIVRLGPNFTFSIGQLFQKASGGSSAGASQKPSKKRVDISHLRRVYENYDTTKLKLEQKDATISSLRMLLSGCLLLGGIISIYAPKLSDVAGPALAAIGPIVAFIIIICLFIYTLRASRKMKVEKAENERKHQQDFVCPECHTPLKGRTFENLLAEGKCPKCKTEYYVSKS